MSLQVLEAGDGGGGISIRSADSFCDVCPGPVLLLLPALPEAPLAPALPLLPPAFELALRLEVVANDVKEAVTKIKCLRNAAIGADLLRSNRLLVKSKISKLNTMKQLLVAITKQK